MKTGDVTCMAKSALQPSFWDLFGASGGPLRTRRRLTRAQRRPQERRNERRGAIWLRAAARQQQQQHSAAAAAAAAVAQASRDNLCSSDASEASDASVASAASHGAGPSSGEAAAANCPERHFPRDEGCPLRLLESHDVAEDEASPPPSPPAGAPSPAPSSPASPEAAPSSTTAVVPAKDALQHRLMLLRRRDGLIDITIRTMKLMRRNQQLQYRLMALQAETRAFVRSVLSNPENRGLRLAPASSPPAFAPASSPALSPAPSSVLAPATASSPMSNLSMAMARP